MIYISKLSYQEKQAIEELRQRMKNDLPKNMFDDTILLYKFLKARDFDIAKAEDMIRKHILYRKHFQLDTILQDFTPRPFFEKFPKLCHLGLDKNKNMVKYCPAGNVDAREVMQCVQLNEYMRHLLWQFEEILDSTKKLKDQIGEAEMQVTLIMNLDKLTLANATNKSSIQICARLMKLMLDNFPESLNAAYIINAPAYYVFIFSIVKGMMSSAMIEKIHVFSYNGWQEKLLEVIDADVLPAFLGGNRTDPDGNPLCTTFVNHGGKIPKMYYLPEEERDFKNRSLVKQLTIPSKQKKEISVHVTETGSRIHWEFLIKHRDIGFGLFYSASNSKFEEILPIHKYDTIDGVEKGWYKCQSGGNYIVVFDNSFSWMSSKEIEYCITVLKTAL